MSIIDKAIAAITPPESEEQRIEARAEAKAAAEPGDWLSLVLDHHAQIEGAFADVEAAIDTPTRIAARKTLAVILTGHAIAEESVLYPALAQAHETGHADMGYTEQVAVKMQMAALEALDPESQAFLDKLEHIRGAVAHHVYQEEGNWFRELKEKAPADVQAQLTRRYEEEFQRYVGDGARGSSAPSASEPRSWEEMRPFS
jgi:hypothetical protein